MQIRKEQSFILDVVCFGRWLDTSKTRNEFAFLPFLYSSVKIFLCRILRFDVLFLAIVHHHVSLRLRVVLVFRSFLYRKDCTKTMRSSRVGGIELLAEENGCYADDYALKSFSLIVYILLNGLALRLISFWIRVEIHRYSYCRVFCCGEQTHRLALFRH